jgi:hypothetical protein
MPGIPINRHVIASFANLAREKKRIPHGILLPYHLSLCLESALFLVPGFLAGQTPQIEQSGATHFAFASDFDFGDFGRMHQECSLHGHIVRNPPYGERL